MKKRTIAIVAGGDSSELPVSLRSAQGIYSFIDKERYNLYIVEMQGKRWEVVLPSGEKTPIDRNDFSFTENGEKKNFDFAYITIHGTPGENGLLQGYFDLIGMPYSTSGVLVEALTFNKFALNNYLRAYPELHISDSLLIRKGEVLPSIESMVERVVPILSSISLKLQRPHSQLPANPTMQSKAIKLSIFFIKISSFLIC